MAIEKQVRYVPVTPGGSVCSWLASKTEKEAWERLLRDAKHMPYKTKANFQKRGYTVERMTAFD